MTTTLTPEQLTGTPEQVLEAVHAAFRPVALRYIARHLARPDWQLAEDLTQETFAHLWTWHISRGAVLDERVGGLLAVIARQAIGHHFRVMRSHEQALDFTDPAVKPVTAAPVDVPHLAPLLGELEAAKDALTVAAEAYRSAHNAHVTAVRALGNSVRPVAVARCTERAHATGHATEQALARFQEAAERVALARAAWNAAAHHTYGSAAVTR